MAKFDKEKLKSKMGGFRDQLKSTGQSKFALDEKEEVCPIPFPNVHPFASKAASIFNLI